MGVYGFNLLMNSDVNLVHLLTHHYFSNLIVFCDRIIKRINFELGDRFGSFFFINSFVNSSGNRIRSLHRRSP